jgi:putative zinc finger protein
MRHADTDSLIAYAEALLAGKERAALDSHVESCPSCGTEAAQWLDLLGLFKAPPLQSAPENDLRQCFATYQIRRPGTNVKEIFASLLSDGLGEIAWIGVRGNSGPQQIHLQTDSADIHLSVSPSPRVMVGQLLARPAGAFIKETRVELIHQNECVGMTITDGLGEFRIPNVPTGNLRLQADLPCGVRLAGEFMINAEDSIQ